MTVEGVTQFTALHQQEPHREGIADTLPSLAAWRSILFSTGGIGQDQARYDGAGFGNVSVRLGPFPGRRGERAFLISGTQTGGLHQTGPEHFCRVNRYDAQTNTVCSVGPAAPSSESMTHGAIYDLAPHLRAVVHVHAPQIFARAKALQLPATNARVAYGTPAMAQEMARLWRETTLPEVRCFSMTGHEDGVVAIGRSLEDAASTLIQHLARALTLEFAADGVHVAPNTPAGAK